ncbi:MAG: hypothetical protein OXD36_02455 [Rhodobacter sp.]|nr:hypothetical protein [Rhodobacter sp.]
MSKMLIPAVTLAGALALAGCGGGGTPALTAAQIAANALEDTADTAVSTAIAAAVALTGDSPDLAGAASAIAAADAAIDALPAGEQEARDDMLALARAVVASAQAAAMALADQAAAEAAQVAAEAAQATAETAQAAAETAQATAEADAMAARAQAATDATAREAAETAQAAAEAAKEAAETAKATAEAAKAEADAAKAAAEAAQAAAVTAKNNAEAEVARLNKQITDAANAERTTRETAQAKKAAADASAVYDRIVEYIASGATVTGTLDAQGEAGSDVSGLVAAKAEHKGIETIRGEGQTWLVAIDDTDGDIGAKIGNEVTTGENVGYYPIADGTGANAGIHRVKADAFTQRVNLEHKTGASFSGEYMGVPGTFKCTGTAGCQSQPAGGGEDRFILSVGAEDNENEWHFKPNDRMAKLEGDRRAEWGWWITDPGEDTEAVNIVYRNFGTEEAVGDGNQDGIQTYANAGKATFTGKALGQYAVVDGADSEAGAFEATADLEASFAGPATKLSGRIHTFDVNSDWEITLKENEDNYNSDASVDQRAFRGTTVWKTGDEDGLGEGAWRAKMFGENGREPTHAVGGFTAVDAGARMVGAFGAEPPE